jgi:hypothetical protein
MHVGIITQVVCTPIDVAILRDKRWYEMNAPTPRSGLAANRKRSTQNAIIRHLLPAFRAVMPGCHSTFMFECYTWRRIPWGTPPEEPSARRDTVSLERSNAIAGWSSVVQIGNFSPNIQLVGFMAMQNFRANPLPTESSHYIHIGMARFAFDDRIFRSAKYR